MSLFKCFPCRPAEPKPNLTVLSKQVVNNLILKLIDDKPAVKRKRFNQAKQKGQGTTSTRNIVKSRNIKKNQVKKES